MSVPLPRKAPPRAQVVDPHDAFWDRVVSLHADARRAYPRVSLATEAAFDTHGGVVCVRLHDISRGGLQVRCPRDIGAMLAPLNRDERGPVTARVSLPLRGRDRTISVSCEVAHVTLLEDDEQPDCPVAMGFCFTGLGREDRRTLDDFIVSHLEPRSD